MSHVQKRAELSLIGASGGARRARVLSNVLSDDFCLNKPLVS